MKYNYYILSAPSELYNQAYSDLRNKSYTSVNMWPRKIFKWKYIFWRIHTGTDINKIITLPFKHLWNKKIISNTNVFYDNTKPICFLLSGIWAQMGLELGLTNTIRKLYPDSKIVWYLSDLICKIPPLYHKSQSLDSQYVSHAKQNFDMIISFDQGDCEKYGLIYYPLFYSKFIGKKENMENSDIYFCAKAKDRLPEIIKAYEMLRNQRLKLDFYLTGVKKENQVYPDEITYGNGMSYSENIQHILHTKCLLEIMQKGGKGYTIRANEAVIFDCKLLTNNPLIKEAPFYNDEFISSFNNPDLSDMDIEFLRKIHSNKEKANYNYKEQMSPIQLIKFIDEKL